MSDKKYLVPEGMLSADHDAWDRLTQNVLPRSWDRSQMRVRYAAALRWLAENPVLPTVQEIEALHKETGRQPLCDAYGVDQIVIAKWLNRMFLEPDVPDEVKNLFVSEQGASAREFNHRIVRAYEIGRTT